MVREIRNATFQGQVLWKPKISRDTFFVAKKLHSFADAVTSRCSEKLCTINSEHSLLCARHVIVNYNWSVERLGEMRGRILESFKFLSPTPTPTFIYCLNIELFLIFIYRSICSTSVQHKVINYLFNTQYKLYKNDILFRYLFYLCLI